VINIHEYDPEDENKVINSNIELPISKKGKKSKASTFVCDAVVSFKNESG